MNSRQKELLRKAGLSEADVIAELKKEFDSAREEVLEKIQVLESRDLTESVKNQIKYKKALLVQIDDIYAKLTPKTVKTVDDYLKLCYEDGFIGALYDIHGQGIPLIFPINQEDMLNAIINDTKLSKSLYESMGFAVDSLKKKVNAEVSRGIAMGSSYVDVARNINNKTGVGMKKAMVIARTEGHRIRMQSTFDAQKKAKDEGADVVKQWDATQDRKTRKHHAELDGQIQEIEDDFVIPSTGKKAAHPGAFGIPHEDINCRCGMLQRAKWALDDDELETLKERADFYGLDKTKQFDDFKEKYLKAVKNIVSLSSALSLSGDAGKEYTDGRDFSWKDIKYQSRVSTKDEAIKYFKNESNIKFSDSRKYKIDEKILVDYANWNDKFNTVFASFDNLNPVRIPALKVKAASSMGTSMGWYSRYSLNARVEELALNATYHRSSDVLESAIKRMADKKWFSGSSGSHVFIHEYGHHISNSMRWIKDDASWEHHFIQECVDEFRKIEIGFNSSTYRDLKEYVSIYGVSSESELFAEAFAEYFGEEEPRAFAKLFGEKLEQVLKGIE